MKVRQVVAREEEGQQDKQVKQVVKRMCDNMQPVSVVQTVSMVYQVYSNILQTQKNSSHLHTNIHNWHLSHVFIFMTLFPLPYNAGLLCKEGVCARVRVFRAQVSTKSPLNSFMVSCFYSGMYTKITVISQI